MQISSVARLSRFVLAGAAALVGFVLCTTVLGSSSQAAVGPVEGTLDTTFGDGGITKTRILGDLTKMRVLANGGIIAIADVLDPRHNCGYEPSLCQDVKQIIRFLPSGELDMQFGQSGALSITVPRSDYGNPYLPIIDFSPDGQIQVITTQQMIRFDRFGNPDSNFGVNGTITFPVLQYYPPGEIKLPTGDFLLNYYDALSRHRVNGALVQSFGQQGVFRLSRGKYVCVRPLTNGKILFGGNDGGLYSPSVWSAILIRLLPNGTLDPSFNNITGTMPYNADKAHQPTAGGTTYCPTVHPNGTLVVSAYSESQYFSFSSLRLYSENGQFLADPTQLPSDLNCGSLNLDHIQSDGKILIIGQCPTPSATIWYQGRLNPDFSLDTSFGENGIITATAYPYPYPYYDVVQTDGRGLRFQQQNFGSIDNSIQVTRYLSGTHVDPTFNGGVFTLAITDVYTGINGPVIVSDSYASAIGLQMDGQIVVGGTYYEGHAPILRGNPYVVLARINGTPVTILRTYLPIVPVTR